MVDRGSDTEVQTRPYQMDERSEETKRTIELPYTQEDLPSLLKNADQVIFIPPTDSDELQLDEDSSSKSQKKRTSKGDEEDESGGSAPKDDDTEEDRPRKPSGRGGEDTTEEKESSLSSASSSSSSSSSSSRSRKPRHIPPAGSIPAAFPASKRIDRLRHLREEMNAARKDNTSAVKDEHSRLNGLPEEGARRRAPVPDDSDDDEPKPKPKARKGKKEAGAEKGKEKDKDPKVPPKPMTDEELKTEELLSNPAEQADKLHKQDAEYIGYHGWDAYKQEAFYRSHLKRTKNVRQSFTPDQKDAKPDWKPNPQERADEKDIDIMVSELLKTKRSQAERKRKQFYDEKDVDYINKRNRVFNERLERSFGKYTAEIKANFERGTAI